MQTLATTTPYVTSYEYLSNGNNRCGFPKKLGNANESIENYKRSLRAAIDESLSRVLALPKYRRDQELHHIAARRHPSAAPARNILLGKDIDIKINSE